MRRSTHRRGWQLESLETRRLLSSAVSGLSSTEWTVGGVTGFVEYEAMSLYTTADGLGTHVTTPGVEAFGVNVDGVADLIITRDDGVFRCTGSLLWTGQHILTAAHCLTDASGNLNTQNVQATFELSSGDVVVVGTQFTVHPLWTGMFVEQGYDVAIITLDAPVDPLVPRYQVYTGGLDLDVPVVKVGYGKGGDGWIGSVLDSGTKRAGLNEWDSSGLVLEPFGATRGVTQLVYDFDNGNVANDGFSFWFSYPPDLGLGADEVMSAPGDSGGPSFINDGGVYKIAGITSFGMSLNLFGFSSDVDDVINNSFGEFGVDTRVTVYAGWIASVVSLPTNTSPIAVDDFYAADEDSVLIITTPGVLSNDSDPDGHPISVILHDSTSVLGALVTVNADGSFSYDPTGSAALQSLAAGQHGSDTFSYSIDDGSGFLSTAMVTIDVLGLNDDPIAVADEGTVNKKGNATVNVLANDSDLDGDPLMVLSVTQPLNGSVVINPDGTLTYTAASRSSVPDNFSYTIGDGNGGTSVAEVTILPRSGGGNGGGGKGRGGLAAIAEGSSSPFSDVVIAKELSILALLTE